MKQINKKLDHLVSRDEIPGYQYLVLYDGDVIHCSWGGYRDLEKKLPVNRDTVFMANSSSKTFTALAVLQLAEKEKLDLDVDVREYVDHIFPVDRKLTCRQLITHTAGIKNPLPRNWHHKLEDCHHFDREKFEHRVLNKNKRLAWEPGQKYLYTNPGYLLLGKIVEAVSGLSFFDYTERHIFRPLKAKEKHIGFRVRSTKDLAHGYQLKFSYYTTMMYLLRHGWMFKSSARAGKWITYRHIVHNSPSYGGLYSNVTGMSLFLKDMLSEDPVLLDKSTRRQMFLPQTTSRGEIVPSTAGWDHRELKGVKYITRPGGGPGFHSNIRVYPQKKLATALFVNKTNIHAKLINQFTDQIDREFVIGSR